MKYILLRRYTFLNFVLRDKAKKNVQTSIRVLHKYKDTFHTYALNFFLHSSYIIVYMSFIVEFLCTAYAYTKFAKVHVRSADPIHRNILLDICCTSYLLMYICNHLYNVYMYIEVEVQI